MKKSLVSFTAVLAAVSWVAISAQKPPSAGGGAPVERGRYLVESVAMCGECHSPRDNEGQLDRSRWLQGAPMWFSPNQASPDWAYRAPALAGLPGFTDVDMTMILEKGLQPNGRAIRPPMHVYHMSHEDATAIVAYLRSLRPGLH
ncbi:MAG TPA: c-type cytochrome [Terriglobia bacterium]|nr:c-type cytochrome [Terriglobia bacterium]